LRVDDVEGLASTIEALGGTVVRGTRTTLDLPGARLDFLYCTDPDGVRIELMDLPG
jgi:predicted enzyme related to lactoylglutathione lyase